MIENKPSIYNAKSVYNQGGGSGTFDVDLGGGVSQTLVFPPYLVPVEYIDMSEYTGNKKFVIECPEQMPILDNRSDLYIKFSVQVNISKLSTTAQKPFCYIPIESSTGNDYIWASIYLTNGGEGRVTIVCGWASHSFTPVDLSKRLNLIVDSKLDLFKVVEIGGATHSATDTRRDPEQNVGRLLLFHGNDANTFFYGKIFFGYVRNATTNKLYSLVIPARSKDPNDKKPYFVEAVSGSVGINVYNDLSTEGVVFGPDIDLSNEIPGWIT